jgi:tRNA (cmo5U34)-methyltransferase
MTKLAPILRMPPLLVRERLANGDRARVPEPMVMDDPEAVAAFDAAGETSPSLIATYDACARSIDALLPEGGRVLDLGSGSGVFLEHLASRRPDVTITGLDLSAPMRATASARIARAGLADRVTLREADVTAIPEDVLEQRVDLVTCLNLLHQLPDEETLTRALGQVARVRQRFGSAVFLMDLARLRRDDTLPRTLSLFDADMSELTRRDAIASEAAAFSIAELQDQLARAGLGDLRAGHARPLAVWQMHWAPGVDGRPAGRQHWVDQPLPSEAARLARVQRFKGLPR